MPTAVKPGCPVAGYGPPWFMAAEIPNKYYQDSCDKIGKEFKDTHDTLIDAVGFARAVYGLKGWEYYSTYWVFWAKVGVFVLVGILFELFKQAHGAAPVRRGCIDVSQRAAAIASASSLPGPRSSAA